MSGQVAVARSNLARRNSNVIGVVVGTEAIYRGEQIHEDFGPQATKYRPILARSRGWRARKSTRRQPREAAGGQGDEGDANADCQNNVRRPTGELIKRGQEGRSMARTVTTGEIWNLWRDNPELAYSVDFIAAHVLPGNGSETSPSQAGRSTRRSSSTA